MMEKHKGSIVETSSPDANQICYALLGMQIASAANFILNNIDMFSDAVSEDDFDKWLEQRTWDK